VGRGKSVWWGKIAGRGIVRGGVKAEGGRTAPTRRGG